MTRLEGILPLSANLEPKIAAPLDARSVVPNFSDLMNTNTFGVFAYKGMIVAVTDDVNPDLRGVYQLQDTPTTDPNNWYNISKDTETLQRISDLEGTTFYVELFESIGTNSGQVSVPTNTSVVLSGYNEDADCLVVLLDSVGKPLDELATTASGEIITTALDASGNFSLSGIPSDYPVGIVYQVSVDLKDLGSIPSSQIIQVEREDERKFKIVPLTSGTRDILDIDRKIYDILINGSDVDINLPEITADMYGASCKFFIRDSDGYEVVLNAHVSDSIEGESFFTFDGIGECLTVVATDEGWSILNHSKDVYTKPEVDALVSEGFKRVNVTSSLDLTAESVQDTVYAVNLTDTDILITLPPSVVENEGDNCFIYIETTAQTNKLTIKASTADTIRGSNTLEFSTRYDGCHLSAHQQGAPHWDVLGWMIDSRTDAVKYAAGNAGVTSIDTLQDLLDYSLSSGRISGGSVTVNPDGTLDIAEAEWKLRVGGQVGDDCRVYFIPAASGLVVSELTLQYLVADYNNGSPQFTVESDISLINCRDKCIQNVLFRQGTQVDVLSLGESSSDFTALYARKQAVTGWLEYGSGLLPSYSGLEFTFTAGVLYSGIIRHEISSLSSAVANFEYWYRDGSGGWTVTTGNTEINNTQYDDGSGTLATLQNSQKGGVHWIYLSAGNSTKLRVVMGQEEYSSIADARAAQIPIDLPPFAQKYSTGKLIGKALVIKDQATLFDIESPFNTVFTSSTPVSHSDLAGLQGGVAGEYYHLSEEEYNKATQEASSTQSGLLNSTDWNTFNDKQDELVSGANLKTINSTSLLGSGNIEITKISAYHLKTKYNTYYYVSTVGSDSNDGTTLSRAFLTIQHAVDTVPDYSIIVVGEGTFEITDQIVVEKPLYLLGSGRDKTIVQIQTGVEERCLWVKQQHEVVVDGFHFTGGRKRTGVTGDSLSGGGVYIGGNDGWGSSPEVIGSYVINCKITDCNTTGSGGGIGLHDYKSSAINCIIQNCSVVSNPIGAAGGVYLRWQAYVYGCYIENCSAPYGGGATAQNGASNLENCTITNNIGSNVLVYGATLYLVNNIIKFPVSGSDVYVLSGSALANNNCTSYDAGNNGNFNSDPLFDGSSYKLLPASPCINAGVKLAWNGSIDDIDGNRRRDNSVGCYEHSTITHNSTDSKQGGVAGEYYHLSEEEYNKATQEASSTQSGLLNSTDWNTFNDKQDELVSGANLKTINSTSLLGSGNIEITGGGAASTYTGVAERDIGSISEGDSFTDATMTEMWDALLRQEKFPTLIPPSIQFTSSVTGLREIGETLSLDFTSSFDRGEITPQYTALSGFRSGLPTQHNLTGVGLSNISSSNLLETVNVPNYTVVINGQSWTANVSYAEGVQPKSSYDEDFDTPLAAGTTSTVTRTITGVYPYFATTVSIGTSTKQSLAEHTVSYNEVDMVAEDASNKQTYWISSAHSAVTGIQFYNTVSGSWEWLGGSKVNSLTAFTISSEDKTIQGNTVTYSKYTHNGSLSGSRQLRFYTN